MVRKTLCAVAVLVTAILSISVALAIPVPPHQFYGTATIDGLAADDGFVIDAKIDGTTYDSSTTDDGNYGYSPELMKVKADDPMTGNKEGGINGETVEFYIGGLKATETAVFVDSTLTELDLTFISICGDAICTGSETSSNCPVDCGTAPPAPPATPQCSDGLDNDGDGDIDYPDDSDCTSASDNSEAASSPSNPPGSSSKDSKRKSSSGSSSTIDDSDEETVEEEEDNDKMSIADAKDGEAITGSAIGVFTTQTAVIGIAILIIAAVGYVLFLKK